MLFHFAALAPVQGPKIEPARIRHVMPMRRIEHACFSKPWTVSDFCMTLRHPTGTCLVAMLQDTVIGYGLAYQPRRWPEDRRCEHRPTEILNLAVHPDFRRRGIGRMLVDAIKNASGDAAVRTLMHERSLAAHLFFRANGFRATAVLRRFYGDQDAYQFEFHGT